MSTFAKPIRFEEALDSRRIKTALPTDLRTKGLQRIPAEVRERAFFSAGVQSAEYLDKVDGLIEKLIDGEISRADARVAMDGLSKGGKLSGDLTNLGSLARQNVILDTNVAMAQGYGNYIKGQDSDLLNLWPAQELVRLVERNEPRNWKARWTALGGRLYAGRMIALKNDPIWTRISRFSLPYPPFDFNSGMGVEDVDRDTAEAAGLLSPDDDMIPESRGFSDDLKATPQVRSQALRSALETALQGIASFDGNALKRLPIPHRATAEDLGMPKLKDIPYAIPEVPQNNPLEGYAKLEQGFEETDPLGNPLRFDQNTLNHWKLKGEELARSGLLDRAVQTVRDPLEVWDQGDSRLYLQKFKKDTGRESPFVVVTRPNGTIDTYFVNNPNQAERKRKGTLLHQKNKHHPLAG